MYRSVVAGGMVALLCHSYLKNKVKIHTPALQHSLCAFRSTPARNIKSAPFDFQRLQHIELRRCLAGQECTKNTPQTKLKHTEDGYSCLQCILFMPCEDGYYGCGCCHGQHHRARMVCFCLHWPLAVSYTAMIPCCVPGRTIEMQQCAIRVALNNHKHYCSVP